MNFEILVFVFKTCSDQILPKLINQGVAAAFFSSRRPTNLQHEKIFLYLEIAEIDMGGGVNFGSRRTILDIKTLFFKAKPVFRGEIAQFDDLFPFFRGKISDVMSPKLEELHPIS